MIKRQVQNLKRLVDDLLDVSRISRGKIELRKDVVELAPVVAEAVEAVRPRLTSSGSNFMSQFPRSRFSWTATQPGWNRFSQTC